MMGSLQTLGERVLAKLPVLAHMVQIVFTLEFGLERLTGSVWSSLAMDYVGRGQFVECRCPMMQRHLRMCGLGLGASTMGRLV